MERRLQETKRQVAKLLLLINLFSQTSYNQILLKSQNHAQLFKLDPKTEPKSSLYS